MPGLDAAGRFGRFATIVSLGFVAAFAAHDASSMPMAGAVAPPGRSIPTQSDAQKSLRDMLSEAGVEVNIAGGLGMTEMDPIVILDADPKAAAATRTKVVDSIHLITGTYWRALEGGSERSDIFRFRQVSVENGHPNPDAGRLFFDASRAVAPGQSLPDPDTHLIPEWGMAPHEIGWLHYQRLLDFESQRPGMGWGLDYRGPQMALTLYVYRGLSEGGTPATVEAEAVAEAFGAAVDEVRATYPNAVELLGADVLDDGFRRQTMVVSGDVWSVVGLTVDRGFYIKYRLSCANDPTTIGLAEETIAALTEIVASQ